MWEHGIRIRTGSHWPMKEAFQLVGHVFNDFLVDLFMILRNLLIIIPNTTKIVHGMIIPTWIKANLYKVLSLVIPRSRNAHLERFVENSNCIRQFRISLNRSCKEIDSLGLWFTFRLNRLINEMWDRNVDTAIASLMKQLISNVTARIQKQYVWICSSFIYNCIV